jgi:hypothetical protein
MCKNATRSFMVKGTFIRVGFNMFEYKSNKAEFLWFLTGYSFIRVGFNMLSTRVTKVPVIIV